MTNITDLNVLSALQAVAEAEKALEVAETRVTELRRHCDHDFEIKLQYAELVADGRNEGNWLFVGRQNCTKCGYAESFKSGAPICADCDAPMVRADERDVCDHQDEFLNAPSTEQGVGGFGLRRAYRCPHCGRPEIFRDPGD